MQINHLIRNANKCYMKVLDRDNEQKNAATDAWSKNWLVPVVLLMLRKWSSYGYELMEKMATFGLAAMNPGTFYRTTTDGEGWDDSFHLEYLRKRTSTAHVFDHRGR